ncbi:MAG: hypothetical protein NVSMB29_15390 [Candidatus Dormibacteria bacterium]
MSERPRLGAPVEVPWWVVPLGLPPVVVTVLAVVAPAPPAARVVAVAASVLMVGVVVGVALRVTSRNLQSVWISAAYGLWFFAALAWGVEALTRPA